MLSGKMVPFISHSQTCIYVLNYQFLGTTEWYSNHCFRYLKLGGNRGYIGASSGILLERATVDVPPGCCGVVS